MSGRINVISQGPRLEPVHLSVVSPVFNEQKCVDELCRQLVEALETITQDYEIVLVDDGSSDHSWEVILAQAARNHRIKGVRFSRNFGHHKAIVAGIDHCRGDWVVVMDSDLQDPPSAIPRLYEEAQKGFDVVLARRKNRQFSWAKNLSARAFYAVYRYLTESNYDGEAGVFRLMSRRVVDALASLRETDRFFPGMVDWVGFPKTHIYVTHGKRFAGETKYPLSKQIQLAVNTMLSFSERPLNLVINLGLLIALFGVLFGIYVVVRGLMGGFVVLGYASILASIYFLGGTTIATIGLIGLYVGRIFRQVKNRPLYVVGESIGVDNHSVQTGQQSPTTEYLISRGAL